MQRPRKKGRCVTKRYAGSASRPTLSETEKSGTNLVEKVFPIMPTFLRNKTFFKLTPLRKENPVTQFNVASHRRLGIRLSFDCSTTLLLGKADEVRNGTGSMFQKKLCKIDAKNRGRHPSKERMKRHERRRSCERNTAGDAGQHGSRN